MFAFLIWTKEPWYNWNAALCTTAPLAFAAYAQTLLVLTVGEFHHASVISHSPCRPRDRSSTTDSWTTTKKIRSWEDGRPVTSESRQEVLLGRCGRVIGGSDVLGNRRRRRRRKVRRRSADWISWGESAVGYNYRVEINLCGNKNVLASVVSRL